jgi:hypothetical protein
MSLPFQVVHPLLDQDPVQFPFGESLLQQNNEPLRLRGVVTSGLQIQKQVLLVAQSPPAFVDVPISFDKNRLLSPERSRQDW